MHGALPTPALSAFRRSVSRVLRPRRPKDFRPVAYVTLVLVAGVLAAGLAGALPSASAATNCTPTSSWGTNRADLATQVVSLINQYRASKGLSQLTVSSTLTASSTWKSLHMAGYGYFAHDDPAPPVARSAYKRATDCGFTGTYWGENIAWGYTTAQSVVNGWLGSSGHKANIENPNFKTTGVGVASNASGSLIWTQSFGNDSSSSTPPPSTPPPATNDTQKPTQPTGLTVTATAQTSVQYRWSASTDNVGVTGYGIYVGGSRIGSATGTSVTVNGLRCGTTYTIGVDAADAAGNRSAVTTTTVTTSACSVGGGTGTDTAAPSTPSGLTVTSTSKTSVGVRWSASTDNVGVAGYRLYRGSTRVATTTGTTFTFTGLACGTSYQLGVEAVDAAGNASGRRTVTASTGSCGFSGWGF
jgi:uncharacterized protein YkwD/chitodextrinase